MRGEYCLPNKHLLYAAQVLTQELYPQIINTIRELAGGALIMLPSSVHDFGNPELADDHRARPSARRDDAPERQVKLLKAAWDAIGSEFGSRHTAIRDVLCRRPLRHQRPQLPHLRLGQGGRPWSTT